MASTKLVFDIGMFDGADSRYYLELGCKVVAVEANPNLVERARTERAQEIAAGKLVVVHRAISDTPGEVELQVSAADLGSSSLFPSMVARGGTAGTFRVATISLADLIAEHGTPDYLKVDIEGADRFAVLAIERARRPQFLSFEVGDDFEELLAHAAQVGYTRFKLIGQTTFLELGNERGLRNRAKERILRWIGYREPTLARRGKRWFPLMHSSGPAPWESDGAWSSASELRAKWEQARAEKRLIGWYDVHAS
jgi:FkbM family methyltransferase